jgi:hypothetical protein
MLAVPRHRIHTAGAAADDRTRRHRRGSCGTRLQAATQGTAEILRET